MISIVFLPLPVYYRTDSAMTGTSMTTHQLFSTVYTCKARHLTLFFLNPFSLSTISRGKYHLDSGFLLIFFSAIGKKMVFPFFFFGSRLRNLSRILSGPIQRSTFSIPMR